jgi:putative endonuclease
MIRCTDGSIYTGITTDVERRFTEHCKGKLGAKYFSGRQPSQIIYREAGIDRSWASKREAEIKKLSREQKELLAASNPG